MKKGKMFQRITNSIAFKTFLFLVLAVSAYICMIAAVGEAWLFHTGAYSKNYEEFMYSVLQDEAYANLNPIVYSSSDSKISMEWLKQRFEKESEQNGVGYKITRNGRVIWDNCDPENPDPFVYSVILDRDVTDGKSYYEAQSFTYECSICVYRSFPKADNFRMLGRQAKWLYYRKNRVIPFAFAAGLLFSIISFVWLMCNVGHKSGKEEIEPGALTAIPLDILAAFFFSAMIFVLLLADQADLVPSYRFSLQYYLVSALIIVLFCTIELLLFTGFCRELTLRMKLGKWWQNTLIVRLGRLVWRILRRIANFGKMIWQGIPSILYVTAAVLLVILVEYMGLIYFRRHFEELIGCWLFEKIILTPVVLYCALAFKKLQKGSKALAEGNLSGKLDTSHLVLDFKKHGEELNRIGDGMAKAVEQRMKSERLKTELITNVSHDIKTPLTSVINYADLLANTATADGELDRGKVEEYSEVLLRQSKRLKKLLDDLLEASKATTGSLEVEMMPCKIGVMLEQAAGEYEARFAENGLKLLIHQPEEEIRILADGRHLWRVFDNLFNNIYKYAQEHSRVYLNVEQKDSRVEVIFRNMSKYELNVSAQELEERFVRGDKARHLEGNGLGLSIAKSLVVLQNGTMDITTDGDLFKVTLGFEILKNEDMQA